MIKKLDIFLMHSMDFSLDLATLVVNVGVLGRY